MAAEVAGASETEKDTDGTSTPMQRIFSVAECSVESVSVYLDRAEVCRSIKLDATPGDHEVIVKGLSCEIDSESIRVEGKGPATISEVSFQVKHVVPDQAEKSEKQKELEQELKEARKKEGFLVARQQRTQKQKDVLNGFADSLTKDAGKNKEGQPVALCGMLDDGLLSGMSGFFDFYEKQASRLDETLHDLTQELEKLRQQILALQSNLRDIQNSSGESISREASILVEVKEAKPVKLLVSYIVYRASWSPKYDLRVFSDDGLMKIHYFGLIQQATGEDWVDAKLSLSTATPSVGGSVPDLGTLRLTFKPKGLYRSPRKAKRTSGSFRSQEKNSPRTLAPPGQNLGSEEMMDGMAANFDLENHEESVEMTVASTEVRESMVSASYDIPRFSTIPCDNNAHKVTVAILDLKPSFSYECVPKKSAHAFLKAKVKNDSAYALLPGPMNIFLDNNFVAKSDLKSVSPSEEFYCSLGVDPYVKVDYKPLVKHRNEAGVFSKSIQMQHKQVTSIKNTRQTSVKLLVTEQLPLSLEEKIKVTLVEPSIKHPEKQEKNRPVRVNRANNIEWELEIPPSETKELVLRYTVEYPSSEELEVAPEGSHQW